MTPATVCRDSRNESTGLPPGLPPCPLCTGPLVPLGGALRCGRCHFTLCEGCEGEAADSADTSE